MTGYQSKKAAAQDSNGMTFADRCQVSEQCLPDTPYRAMLTKLHNEMLAALAQPEQERNFCPRCGKRTNDIHTCTPPQENT